ncbi:MAG: ATP-binding cassette domain-containing protein [Deinococcales bacterium]
MLLAALQQVSKSYGDQIVLDKVNLEIRSSSRLALIGRNGTGKSTLLRLLMNLEKPDSGSVYLAGEVTLAMLEQDPTFNEAETVNELSMRAFQEIETLERGLQGPDMKASSTNPTSLKLGKNFMNALKGEVAMKGAPAVMRCSIH